ncbi:MAG: FtsX-like permease family protein [Marinoscillum sp.]
MSQVNPPKWIQSLLKRYFRKDLWEAIEGDLYEIFLEEAAEKGDAYARRRYIFNALAFLRYQRLRQYSTTRNNMDLFKNYLKVTLRDIKRHKSFAAINLFGLITGFMVLLFVLQFVLFETNYDRFHEKSDRTYRVINDRYQNGKLLQHGQITYPTVGPTLFKDYPEVEAYSRLTVGGRNYLHHDDEQFLVQDYLWADEHFFDVFEFPMLTGEKATALDESAKVVFTESYARRFLKEGEKIEDLIGQFVVVNDWDFPSEITGIVQDLPVQSHLSFDMLISYKTFIRLAGEGADKSWEWSDFYHYVVLADGTDQKSFESKMVDFGNKYFKDGEVSGATETFHLQPLHDAHLDNTLEYEFAKVTDGSFIYLIIIIAVIIMIIVWINYINLTTSRSMQRAKEVGVRKSMGAFKGQLIGQFLTESLMLNLIGLFIAIALVLLLQPVFNAITSLPLDLTILVSSALWGLPFVVWFLLGFVLSVLAIGIYPALLISGFKPQDVLKGKYSIVGDLVTMRKVLVISQFAAALILVSGSVAVYRQIDFMRTQDLGMKIDNNLVIYGPDLTAFDSVYISKFDRFKHELMSRPGIESVTSAGRMFGDKMPRSFRMRSSADMDQVDHTSNWLPVDFDFINQFGIEMRAGRTFNQSDYHTNGGLVRTAMVNESALELFNFENAEKAIGATLVNVIRNRSYEIVGVVSDFHQRALNESIEPIIFFPFYDNSHYISVKFLEGMEEKAIAESQTIFEEFYPGNYFDYFFLEDHFDMQYQSDERIGHISAILTVLAIILAVLGLFGLVLITLMKKTKEIGVRKVLGAGLMELLYLFGKHFLGLIGISAVIGIPVSYFLIKDFLQDYAYSTGVEIWVLMVSATVMIVICALTVLFQTGRIANNNPVESLRYE